MKKAIELVLFAIKNGKNGDIFVPKTPATDLNNIAAAVQIFMKFKFNKIKIIGKRHGEKMHEELMTDEEMEVAKKYDKYFKISSDLRDLNYNLYFNKGKIRKKQKSYSSNNSYFLKKDQLIKIFNQVKNDLIKESIFLCSFASPDLFISKLRFKNQLDKFGYYEDYKIFSYNNIPDEAKKFIQLCKKEKDMRGYGYWI